MFHGQLEGTGVEVLDPRFERCIIGHARVERLWTGARWSEGPAWFAAGRYLVWSDIPNNRILRFDDCSGAVAVKVLTLSPPSALTSAPHSGTVVKILRSACAARGMAASASKSADSERRQR